jgi:hypothetical protein
MNRGRVGKRFEAGEFDMGQAHGGEGWGEKRGILNENKKSVR